MSKLILNRETVAALEADAVQVAAGVDPLTLPFSRIPGCGVSCVAPCTGIETRKCPISLRQECYSIQHGGASCIC